MRTSTILLSLALCLPALAFVPAAAADPQCESLTRALPGGGSVSTSSCYDSYTCCTGYFVENWQNRTVVESPTPTGHVARVTIYSSWYHSDYNGNEEFSRNHQYSVDVFDPSWSTDVRYAGVGASNSQGSYAGDCYENTNVGLYAESSQSAGGANQGIGSGAGRALPCTSDDVQVLLP